MANQRSTFAKRNREMKLKDSAKAKAERREARKTEKRDTKGPAIAWDQPGGVENAATADTGTDTPSPSGGNAPASDTDSTPSADAPRSSDTNDVDR